MSLWFHRTQTINSQTLRECAEKAGVTWEYQTIYYRANGIGYKNGDSTDAKVIKDEFEKLLGYRPVVIDEPTIDTNQTDQI
jgi:hypothetical protein